MERCWSCGATVSPAVGWCGQCYASTASGQIAEADARLVPHQRSAADDPLERPESPDILVVIRHSRWARTETTMGPVGRLVTSALVLVPIPLCAFGGPIAWAAGLVYSGTMLPMAMRDIWKVGRIRQVASGTPSPTHHSDGVESGNHSPRSGIPAAR